MPVGDLHNAEVCVASGVVFTEMKERSHFLIKVCTLLNIQARCLLEIVQSCRYASHFSLTLRILVRAFPGYRMPFLMQQ